MKQLFLSLLFIAAFSIQAMQTEKTDAGSTQHSDVLSTYLEVTYFQTEDLSEVQIDSDCGEPSDISQISSPESFDPRIQIYFNQTPNNLPKQLKLLQRINKDSQSKRSKNLNNNSSSPLNQEETQ